MNGRRLFLDTNTVIALLRGDKYLLDMCEQSEWIGSSVITYLGLGGALGYWVVPLVWENSIAKKRS